MQPSTVYSLSHEVVTRIGSLLFNSNDVNVVTSRKALISLATTCRYLSEPLLDIIWRELPDTIPLFLLLPSDLCTTTVEEIPLEPWYKQRTELVLLRTPVADDFKRVAMYSHRVKILGYRYDQRVVKPRHEDYKIPSHVWDMLAMHGPAPLLPNLVELHCTLSGPRFDTKASIDHLHEIMLQRDQIHGPIDFSLGICSGSSSAHEVIQSITRIAPNLRAFQWFQTYAKWDLRGQDICNLPHMSELDALSLQVAPDTLHAIGALPKLSDLAVAVDFSTSEWRDWNYTSSEHSVGLFPVLVQLQLETVNLSKTAELMKTITSPFLANLTVKVRSWNPSGSILAAFCSAVGGSPFQRVLRSLDLTIQGSWSSSDGNPTYPTHSKVIGPLLSLGRLEKLRLEAHLPMVFLDNAFVDEMSRAWPNIREIRFAQVIEHYGFQCREEPIPSIGDPDCPKVTLLGLSPLAKRCQYLQVLQVPVDMRIRSPERLEPACRSGPPLFLMRSRRSDLHTFIGEGCVMGDPWEVASCLSLMFPQIRKIRCGHSSIAKWSFMSEVYSELLRVRSEEWGWANQASQEESQ
ncbi:hypothetical protein C8Q70DRAFT_981517 [Cubamyces menziesii]|nr:hypothetical protein C8Q70DRAFT_981517 [Cubamyces menziesii]